MEEDGGGEKGREREKDTSMCERYLDELPLTRTPVGDLACNPDMCPYWD